MSTKKLPKSGDKSGKNIGFASFEEKTKWIQGLGENEGRYESPIDINLSKVIPVELPFVEWHHHDLPPKKMKLTNSGHTIILSAKWYQERPYLCNGPLPGNYVFSQLHFHWGANNMEGSEHTIDGAQQPLEMHAVFFKSCYLTQEAALKEKDGIVVLAYFFRLQNNSNPSVQVLVDALEYLQKPNSSARIDALPLCFLVRQFVSDYYLYWGAVTTSDCLHVIMWLITREPIAISAEQLECFRTLTDANHEPLIRNFRRVQPLHDRNVFHVNPSTSQYATLLPVPSDEFKFTLSGNYPKPLIKESDTVRSFYQQQQQQHQPQQQIFVMDGGSKVWSGKSKSKRRKEV